MNFAKVILTLLAISLFSICFSQTSTSSDGNWSSGGNWTSGVPDKDEVATITNNMTINQDIEVDTDGSFTINGGTAIDPNGGSDYKLTVQGTGYFEVGGNVTFGGDLNLKNEGEIVVKGCDTLTIGGNAVIENNSDLTVESCAVLIIEGDLEVKNNVDLFVDGQVKVEGNMEASNNAEASGSGNIQVDGSTDFTNSANFFGEDNNCSDCDYGGGNPLPIQLVNFRAYYKTSTLIEVLWETASEINNDYYTIEYSTNGVDFYEAKTVSGAGNSFINRHYKVEILVGTTSPIYVRLTQTDYDGSFRKFDPVLVKKTRQNSFTLTNNPGNGEEVKLIPSLTDDLLEIVIFDITGKELFKKNYTPDSYTSMGIELPTLSKYGKGTYFVLLKSYTTVEQEVLIVQ